MFKIVQQPSVSRMELKNAVVKDTFFLSQEA